MTEEMYKEEVVCRLCNYNYENTSWICSHCGICINCGEHDTPYSCIIWDNSIETLARLL